MIPSACSATRSISRAAIFQQVRVRDPRSRSRSRRRPPTRSRCWAASDVDRLGILLERDSRGRHPAASNCARSRSSTKTFEQVAPFLQHREQRAARSPTDSAELRVRRGSRRQPHLDENAPLNSPHNSDRVQHAAFNREGLDEAQAQDDLELRNPAKIRKDARLVNFAGQSSIDELEMGKEVEGRVMRLDRRLRRRRRNAPAACCTFRRWSIATSAIRHVVKTRPIVRARASSKMTRPRAACR